MHAKPTRTQRFVGKLIGIILAAALTMSAAATTYHVDGATGDDTNDGESWPQAYKTLQKAFDSVIGGDVIWVAAETYYPDECDTCGPGGTDSRSDTYDMVLGVSVFGGFLNGDAFEDRDPEANETILSGDIQQDGDPANYSFRVVTFDVAGANRPVLDGFTVTKGNAENGIGGGISVRSAGAVIRNCLIKENQASVSVGEGGGIGLLSTADDVVTIRDCVFTNNHANFLGGALSTRDSGETTIVNCRFSANDADQGGAINLSPMVEVTVVNCEFLDNAAREGGAIHIEVGDFGATVINSLFTGNTAEDHGGAVDAGESSTLVNCTFSGNSVSQPPPGEGGGAISVELSAHVLVANSILWGNTVGTDPPMPEQIRIDPSGGSATVSFSDVEGGGWIGFGNIDADPLFVDPLNGNYRLQRCSPCIDAGSNLAVPPDTADLNNDGDTDERTPLDLDLSLRFLDDPLTVDSGAPDPPAYPDIADMGTYERLDLCPWDLNGDCCVDRNDLAILLGQWGQCPAPPAVCPADFNCDGWVRTQDQQLLIAHFGLCPNADPLSCPPVPGPQCLSISGAGFQGAVGALGFGSVGDLQAWLMTAEDGEAFVCGCALWALLPEEE